MWRPKLEQITFDIKTTLLNSSFIYTISGKLSILKCLYHSILHILLLRFSLIYSCSMSEPQHDSMPSCAGIWMTAHQSYSSSQKGNWILVKIGTCLQMRFKPMQLKMLNNNPRRMIYDWHALKRHIKYAHRCVPRLKWFMMVGFTNAFEKAVPGLQSFLMH